MRFRWSLLLIVGILGSRPDAAGAQVNDDVSREVVLLRRPAEIDATSRQVFLELKERIVAPVSRQVVILRRDGLVDAISRQVVFFRSDSLADAISREYSLSLVGTVEVPEGFIAREYARIPNTPAEWMSLAVQPHPALGFLDLYVATTTAQFGALGDPPDDFLYSIDRATEAVEELGAFPASDTDPVDLEFPAAGGLGTDLYVTGRHRDGFLTGDYAGSILRVAPADTAVVFFCDLLLSTSPLGMALKPTSGGGFDAGVYYVNESGSPHSIVGVDAAANPTGYAVDHVTGFECVAFGPGNAFGSDLYVGDAGGSIHTVDASGNVTAFAGPLGASIQSLSFSSGYGFEDKLFVVLGNGTVVRVDSSGQSEPFLSGILIEPLDHDVVRNDLTFTPLGDILYVSDARRGVVYGIQAALPTGAEGTLGAPERTMALVSNFPNPFNPSTTIRFHLPTHQRASLAVFDGAGRLVRDLLPEAPLEAGEHRVRWDGLDNSGQPVSSGVYFALLRAGGSWSGHKMLLLK